MVVKLYGIRFVDILAGVGVGRYFSGQLGLICLFTQLLLELFARSTVCGIGFDRG